MYIMSYNVLVDSKLFILLLNLGPLLHVQNFLTDIKMLYDFLNEVYHSFMYWVWIKIFQYIEWLLYYLLFTFERSSLFSLQEQLNYLLDYRLVKQIIIFLGQ